MGNTNQCGYQTRSVAGAAASGIANGLAGLIGLGAFWSPSNNQGLKQANQDFQDLKNKWDELINDQKNQLTDLQKQFINKQQQLILNSQAFTDEIMDDKIETNTLFIQIIFCILVIVIIYLIVL